MTAENKQLAISTLNVECIDYIVLVNLTSATRMGGGCFWFLTILAFTFLDQELFSLVLSHFCVICRGMGQF